MKRCRSEFEAWRYLADQASVRRFPRTAREAFRDYGPAIEIYPRKGGLDRAIFVAIALALIAGFVF